MAGGGRDPRLEAASRLETIYRRYAESNRKRRNWSALNRGNIAIRAELLARVVALADRQIRGVGAILDIGCGSGWILAQLAQRGVAEDRLHGVDLIPARVDAARRKVPAADVRPADARALPYEQGRFQLVLLFTCLSSMETEQAMRHAVTEADRVLGEEGLLLCYEPRIPNPLNRATQRVPRKMLRETMGGEAASMRLTGLPPLARRLGSSTSRLYPLLSKLTATHRLSAYRTSKKNS